MSIVRLTKVLHGGLSLLASWKNALSKGEVIQPFSDYFCSPVLLSAAVEGTARIAEQGMAGIWHLSPEDQMSYAQMAGCLGEKLGFERRLIEPRPCPEGLIEHRPVFTTLGNRETKQRLGLDFAHSRLVLEQALSGDYAES